MNYEKTKYKEIGEQVISDLFPKLLNVKIAWLASDKAKAKDGKTTFADCRKVSEQYDWCCNYDFIITVYEPNVANFTPEQLKILIEHELMHVGVDENKYYIIPHDAEEFTEIIRKYGIDWARAE